MEGGGTAIEMHRPMSGRRADMPRIRVLGPISIAGDSGWQPVRGRSTRATLGALVIAVRHVVSTDRLIDAVWGARPPPSALASLHSHISRLRALLGERTIRHFAEGYLLDLPCSRIDACRFERLAVKAEQSLAADPETSYRHARSALRLWLGSPFGDLSDDEFLYLEVRRLDELRHAVAETALAAELEIGRVAEAVASLQSLVSEDPYREHLWYLLALGLAREGRRLEAIAALDRYGTVVAAAGLAPDRRIENLRTAIDAGTVATTIDA
jgi:DNA-binding SARP family transcriptional activator